MRPPPGAATGTAKLAPPRDGIEALEGPKPMNDNSPIDQRVAALTPERRRLLEKLARAQPTSAVSTEPPPQPQPDPALRLQAPVAASDTKRLSREFYDNVSRQLDGTAAGEYAMFLNYGYASTQAREESPITLPARVLNRNPVKLVLELIGRVDLRGLEVLDVGCGRGGTADVIRCYFGPKRFTGLDLAPEAIAYCRRTHTHAGFTFEVGDAEQLPFRDGEFDVVTNVESSHNYPDVFAFLLGVHRVLRPGGRFLHTDNVPAATWDATGAYLCGLNMTLEHERDITDNVLRSCDETAAQHRQAFGARNDAGAVNTFLAVPGSPIYEDMRSDKSSYRILHWRKAG
jgi:phthiocerol/phenolphthiocerol synthesis type-I polyketide synthase E